MSLSLRLWLVAVLLLALALGALVGFGDAPPNPDGRCGPPSPCLDVSHG